MAWPPGVIAGAKAEIARLGLRPMAEFDPDMPDRVYDSLNREFFDWLPERADEYRQHPEIDELGQANFEGILILGGQMLEDPRGFRWRHRLRSRGPHSPSCLGPFLGLIALHTSSVAL